MVSSVSNLRKSVEALTVGKYMKSENHKAMLLSPKLATQFGCNNQPLVIKEMLDQNKYYCNYPKASGNYVTYSTKPDTSSHMIFKHLDIVNLKASRSSRTAGVEYLRGPTTFFITDDLIVTPLSSISCISFLGREKVPFDDLEERVANMTADEALKLAEACFITKCALTHAFINQRKPKQNI
ncbi:hypothetical protein GIB67_007614 [Kingdonia uniflora]|uniref:Uncharacterized protein n=1 Tax=Kingdonia uniflora TaxID=39325 RepID=A0A7J7N1G7_9MAGN|nr:hypothetical protein GIB67_007614 [Kingdonia uniflora]